MRFLLEWLSNIVLIPAVSFFFNWFIYFFHHFSAITIFVYIFNCFDSSRLYHYDIFSRSQRRNFSKKKSCFDVGICNSSFDKKRQLATTAHAYSYAIRYRTWTVLYLYTILIYSVEHTLKWSEIFLTLTGPNTMVHVIWVLYQ